MTWAIVVLPVPGGPHRMTDDSRSDSMSDRSGLPGPSRCSCPTTSSSGPGSESGRERGLTDQPVLGGRGEQVLRRGHHRRGYRWRGWRDPGRRAPGERSVPPSVAVRNLFVGLFWLWLLVSLGIYAVRVWRRMTRGPKTEPNAIEPPTAGGDAGIPIVSPSSGLGARPHRARCFRRNPVRSLRPPIPAHARRIHRWERERAPGPACSRQPRPRLRRRPGPRASRLPRRGRRVAELVHGHRHAMRPRPDRRIRSGPRSLPCRLLHRHRARRNRRWRRRRRVGTARVRAAVDGREPARGHRRTTAN